MGEDRAMIGCAVDTWRFSGRRYSDSAWRTDRRMRRLEVGGHVLRILDGGGPSPAVLFAADAPVVLEHYLPLIDRLSRRAIAIEMPGFGFSTPARGYRFGLDEQVAVLASLMDALALDRATLAFTCINAVTAVAFAARHPARVERLVLAQAPSVDEMVRWARRIDLRVLGRGLLATPIAGQAVMWAAPAAIAGRWFAAALAPDADAAAFTATSRRVYDQGGAFCLAALNQAMGGVRAADVGVATVPTTIVWGEDDRTHLRTDKPRSVDLAPGAELVRWPGVGHCPDLERPARFAALL
jgi:pimeloyl-ACP methyl ester carboxylesterase